MPSTPHIRILMCTLNGAEYLHEQLASFLRQSHDNWSLWISDDGSSDATLEIIGDFRAANRQRDIQVFVGSGQGAAANYLSLISRVEPEAGVLVALSDQDDVWLPDKLTRAAAAIADCGRCASAPPLSGIVTIPAGYGQISPRWRPQARR